MFTLNYIKHTLYNSGIENCPLVFLGTPRIVRADCGTENVVVAGLQRFFRSQATDDFAGNKSFLYGKSSENQVVEYFLYAFRSGGIIRTEIYIEYVPFLALFNERSVASYSS